MGKSFDLRKLINQVRDAKEAWNLVQSWPHLPGDDRSQTIVVTALLEQGLEQALATHFVVKEKEVRSFFADQTDGSMSTFAMKIKLAHALGVIEDKVKAELTTIKNIRNVFAHTRASVTFDTPEIKNACDALKLFAPVALIAFPGLLGSFAALPKDKFGWVVKLIYLYFATIETGSRKPRRYAASAVIAAAFLLKLIFA
jgi:hypothetical protein